MKSYSFHKEIANERLFYEIWTTIGKLKWYFYKFAKNNAEEAMQLTLEHCLTHYNPNISSLDVYVKSLAREITKDNGRLVFIDFIEQTLSGDSGDTGEREKNVNLNVGRVRDFSDDIVENMLLSEDRRDDIIELALQFMDKFIVMCEALINNDTTVVYYPEVYIKACLKLNKLCRNFNKSCISLYMDYAPEFKKFLDSDANNVGEWLEADFSYISTNTSKRIRLVNSLTGLPVNDADKEKLKCEGKLVDKRVLRIPYSQLWETLCDMVDSEETNEIKFVLGDQYIFKTLGGSLSVANTSLFNMYDLIKNEIITNVLHETRGRLLSVGSECIYVLTAKSDVCIEPKSIRGISIELKAEDITESL